MDNMLSSKMDLLRDFYVDYKYDPDWQEFIAINDLGLPLSYLYSFGLVEPTKAGELEVIETWNSLCKELDLDPYAEYESIEDMINEG
jgi:hypothetical protein